MCVRARESARAREGQTKTEESNAKWQFSQLTLLLCVVVVSTFFGRSFAQILASAALLGLWYVFVVTCLRCVALH